VIVVVPTTNGRSYYEYGCLCSAPGQPYLLRIHTHTLMMIGHPTPLRQNGYTDDNKWVTQGVNSKHVRTLS
jgi:hypothetical protein